MHRTYLDGLAPERQCLGRPGRAAVRLGGADSRLGIAEGIETALAATALFGVRCWATLGTERFAHVILPAEVTDLLLFVGHDHGGGLAESLARQTFGDTLRIEVYCPLRVGDDWNDELRRRPGS